VRAGRCALLAFAVGLAAAGCVTIHQPAGGDPSTRTAAALPVQPADRREGVALGLPPPASFDQDENAVARLTALRDRRLAEGEEVDTPIGVGDVLEVAVPEMRELAKRTARVAGDGNIALPFVGTIRAAGRTEEQVRTEIVQRLGTLMYDPQVSVFVREYHSRQVAVLGSVGRPGTYLPTSGNDTILDMIATARGITNEGARQVVFIPREVSEAPEAKVAIARVQEHAADAAELQGLLRNVEPIVLNLRDMTARTTELVLSVPVRPGDVLIIPEAGKVFLQGWVNKPGPYDITRDLTMLSVIAAAGGPSFPADMGAARLIRASVAGDKQLFDVNLQAIASGTRPDVYVQNGDVIEIGATGPKLAAYGLYYFFASVFRIGAAVTVF
jgi:protein involved in polysaccharide export with SLBB domain